MRGLIEICSRYLSRKISILYSYQGFSIGSYVLANCVLEVMILVCSAWCCVVAVANMQNFERILIYFAIRDHSTAVFWCSSLIRFFFGAYILLSLCKI